MVTDKMALLLELAQQVKLQARHSEVSEHHGGSIGWGVQCDEGRCYDSRCSNGGCDNGGCDNDIWEDWDKLEYGHFGGGRCHTVKENMGDSVMAG